MAESESACFANDGLMNSHNCRNMDAEAMTLEGEDSLLISGEDAGILAPGQHTIIGVYLIIVGVTGLIGNSAIIAAILRYRSVLTSPLYLVLLHLCIADTGICTFSGFPFSGVSSLAGRWLYGDRGCQMYAFSGFFFGLAIILFLTIYSITSYFSLQTQPKIRVNETTVYRGVVLLWFYSLFWSVAPLLGWASYTYEPSVTTCTLNWQNNDASYKSYTVTLSIFVFVVPLAIISNCYFKSLVLLKRPQGDKHIDVVKEKDIIKTGVIMSGGYFTLWSLYAVLTLWTVFGTVESVPHILTVLPPLFAKVSPVLNPLVILYYDVKLRQAAYATVCCKSPPSDFFPSQDTALVSKSEDN